MASSSKKILGKEDLANISSRMNMDFSRKIVEHLDRLPDRYYINLDNNIEDLIMHIRLLELAKYAKQLPVMIDVRSIQDDRESHETMQLVTQITVASDNTVRPMLFKQVLNAFAAMNLTFEDACAYQTTDKYTLGVFNLVECGYEVEDLKQALAKELYKLDTSEATVPPQHVAIEIGQQDKVGCSSWSGWTWPEVIIAGVGGLAALWCLGCGVALILGAKSDHFPLGYLSKAGKRVGESVDLEDKDIGVAVVFVIVPLLGIASVVLLLAEAICKLIRAMPAAAIISWLLIGLMLDGFLPFVKVTISSLKEKAMEMLATLVTLSVTVTNFYRKKN